MPSVAELKQIARDLGIRGYSSMKRDMLIKSIEEDQMVKNLVEKHKSSAEVKATEEKNAKNAEEAQNAGFEPAKEKKVEETEPVAKPPPKKTSLWTQYLHETMKEKGCTYKQAMTVHKDGYAAYKEKHAAK